VTTHVDVVKLPGDGNFALISQGRIVYALGATAQELQQVLEEERGRETIKPLEEDALLVPSVTLGLIPTFDCNLGCIYCYARGGESKEILSLETGKEAILSASTVDNRDILYIYLVGGGEPLLYINLVRDLVAFANTVYKTVYVNVVSNGTFDQDVLDWLISINANIRISYDGVMQDVQRPYADGRPSSVDVERNIQMLVARGASVIVQCIVTKAGIHSMRDTADKVHALGVDSIKFEPALATDVSRANAEMEPDPQVYAEELLQTILYIAEQGYDLTVDTGFFSEPALDHYCGMAVSNRVVTPQGKVTACVEVARSTDPYASLLLIGEIKDGKMAIDPERRKALLGFHADGQIGGCSTCNLKMLCHGGCPMANIWRGGLPLRKSMFTCTLEKVFLPKLLLMLAEDPRISGIVMEDGDVDRF
jgi:uncharacterized protein